MNNIKSEKSKPFCVTAAELVRLGADSLPRQFVSGEHLIYSSPASLSFNSPGAQGFGVKRASLSVPGSVLLLVSPGCCGRNTSGISELKQYKNRFFFLNMDEADIVTGKHLKKIPDAVAAVISEYRSRTGLMPSVVMICITCLDALLGTDMERVCRKAEEQVGVFVRPCYMYALTREGRKPPMVHIRQSLYSLLETRKKRSTSINLLGYFSPLTDDCELYDIFHGIGVRDIREISRCTDFDEFLLMGEANFNVVLNPEARPAAADLERRLGIPYIELKRLYQIDKVERQYQALGKALNKNISIDAARHEARAAIDAFKKAIGDDSPRLAVGEFLNGDPFELSLSFIKEGLIVSEIFGTVSSDNFIYIKRISELSPETLIYSNLDPSIIHYDEVIASHIDIAVGTDAAYYHPHAVSISFRDDIQPFGFSGIKKLYSELLNAYRLHRTGTARRLKPNADISYTPTMSESTAPHANIRGLRRFLPPFAPDAAGASSVLYSLGGITVICDAGGCAGNICGFDEPRWLDEKSAIYSAGLRDMDAILGRDDRLISKLEAAVRDVGAENVSFAAVIGTPVPAITATDYHALKRLCEQRAKVKTLCIDTTGMELYDIGAEKAYMELFREFSAMPKAENVSCAEGSEGLTDASRQSCPKNQNKLIGILGATPLDTGMAHAEGFFSKLLNNKRVCCFDSKESLNIIRSMDMLSENMVVSPSGIRAAEYIKNTIGVPYRICYPGADRLLSGAVAALKNEKAGFENEGFLCALGDDACHDELARLFSGKTVLVLHQHVLAHAVSDVLRAHGAAHVEAASWFKLVPGLEGTRLCEEDDLIKLILNLQPDIIISDKTIAPLANAAGSRALIIDMPHFAVSGRLMHLESDLHYDNEAE